VVLVVVIAVLAVFRGTRGIIDLARDELGALALFASTVSVLDGFPGIVDAIVFHVFTPGPLLFAASSLFGGFRTHQNPLLEKAKARNADWLHPPIGSKTATAEALILVAK
jgi:hypothetical protein